jgi:catechol 2,3-dioxygenase-like lactoylglutathione lyase family enzyme
MRGAAETGRIGCMEKRISLVTLGVADLARAQRFYAALGWHGQEVQETVFVQAGGLALVLWGRDKLAADCGLDDDAPAGFGGIVLAHNVRTADEVDEIVAAAQRAGATVTRAPSTTFYGGYAGVFTDPDGHPWEIACNPGFPLGPDGSLTIPDMS